MTRFRPARRRLSRTGVLAAGDALAGAGTAAGWAASGNWPGGLPALAALLVAAGSVALSGAWRGQALLPVALVGLAPAVAAPDGASAAGGIGAAAWLCATAVAAMVATRAPVRAWLASGEGRRRCAPRAVLLGADPAAARLLAGAPETQALAVLGYADARPAASGPPAGPDGPLPYLGRPDRIPRLIGVGALDAVVLAPSALEAVPALSCLAVELRLALDLAGSGPRLVPIARVPLTPFARTVKRAEDVVLGAAALLLCAVPMALVAAAVRLDSPGPVLFRQRRTGLNGRRFTLLKFRTMHAACADPLGAAQARPDDPRLTRLGALLRRTSLDELPQLFNVLRGDMALVGPRPHALGTRVDGRRLEAVCPRYPARHRVRPGLTGLAQVRGLRGALTSEAALRARLDADLHYIETWSLGGDLLILWRTAWAVLCQRGAF
jgi:lipopolysaccharide/colanic/teichoic acid biosynthesis glycosyltransferase